MKLIIPVAVPEDVTTCRVVGNVACHVPYCVKSACDQDLDYIFVLRGRCCHLAATRPRCMFVGNAHIYRRWVPWVGSKWTTWTELWPIQ